MTDPDEDTQPHAIGAATGPAASGPDAAASDASASSPPGADPADTPPPSTPPASEPGLKANPERPADSGWREPPWFPADKDRDRGLRDRDRTPSLFAIVVGLGLIAIGVYYFLDRTLGIALPRIQWNTVWPVVLIVLGGLILVRSMQRKP